MSSVINEKNEEQFTYKHDKHYNAKGYKLFAEKLTLEINKTYPDIYNATK